MAEVTYLLGAGASWERIPTVIEMSESIKKVISEMTNMRITGFNYFDRQVRLDKDVLKELPEIIEDLEWMNTNNDSHSSIDTFAKKLFLTQSEDLKKLKLILSFYFTYLQITGVPDKRYDNFWASILYRPELLPHKIKVLSWNYDFQMEQSYMNLFNQPSIHNSRQWLNLLNYNQQSGIFDDIGFGIVKLNGSADVYKGNESMFNENRNNAYASNSESLITRYSLFKRQQDVKTRLSFAWESNLVHLERTISPFVLRTEVVAVIGYSFPFFNREIDIQLFKMMKNLRLIYIQDRDPSAMKERLIEILDDPNKVEIKLIHDLKQFVFPKELELTSI